MNTKQQQQTAACLAELDRLTRGRNLTRTEQVRANFLIAQIAFLKSGGRRSTRRGLSPAMRAWQLALQGEISLPQELRDMSEGTAGFLSWTASGGYLVPFEFYRDTINAMAQVDPLLSEDDVTLLRDEEGEVEAVSGPERPDDDASTFKAVRGKVPVPLALRPKQIAGWDLSTIAATQIAEGGQDVVSTPSVLGDILNGYMFKCSIGDVSFQLEQDAFETLAELLARAYGVAFARGIGSALVNGTGSNQPQGLLTAAANSGVTTADNTTVQLDDLDAIYFSVDRIYRNSPRARWVMNDETYKLTRSIQATLNSSADVMFRPGEDAETIFGKKVLICPSMPSGAGSKAIVFGDLSHFVVRLSALGVQRTVETPHDADYFGATYHGRMRADSTLFDPSGGSKPPIVYATLHS